MEGTAQTMQECTHAASGEPSTEGFLDPVAHLSRRFEAAGGDRVLEVVELAGLESTRVAFVLQGAKGLESALLVKFQPVADSAGTDVEKFRNLIERQTFAQPEQGGKAVVDANIFLFAAQFFDLLAQQSIQRETARTVHHGDFSSAS
jgi:hypothetical protein